MGEQSTGLGPPGSALNPRQALQAGIPPPPCSPLLPGSPSPWSQAGSGVGWITRDLERPQSEQTFIRASGNCSPHTCSAGVWGCQMMLRPLCSVIKESSPAPSRGKLEPADPCNSDPWQGGEIQSCWAAAQTLLGTKPRKKKAFPVCSARGATSRRPGRQPEANKTSLLGG